MSASMQIWENATMHKLNNKLHDIFISVYFLQFLKTFFMYSSLAKDYIEAN